MAYASQGTPRKSRYVRGVCAIAGCGKITVYKGKYKGRKIYNLHCHKHNRSGQRGVKELKQKIDRSKCSLCGWTGPCDVHRIIWGKDGGTYSKDNISVVCPNCHRLIHFKRLCLCKNNDGRIEPLKA